MNDELKPCPFCGGEARTFEFSWHASQFGGHMFEKPYWQVICESCKAAIGDFDSKAEAIEAWNTRAERTCRNTQHDTDFMCSVCGKCVDNGRILGFNHCPNCGARIEVDDG